MKIATVELDHPMAIAPMAGMTDSAFRRLVKRHGGCGLVVTEMVSSEGLVRGIDRTLEYAEYTEEERPVSIQIFGGDPGTMAAAAQIVERLGADVVDINMGCPVPKIAKHHAGCSLMREPRHAAAIVGAMAKAVKIPVTVKMRAGWNEEDRNAPLLARMVEDAGAAAVAVHGRTAAQSYSGHSDWTLIAQVAEQLSIPVFGSGDCVEPEDVIARLASGVQGVLVGRGVLRNPWMLGQAADLASGRHPRIVTLEERGRFLLEYMGMLLKGDDDEGEGFRHVAAASTRPTTPRSRERWVVNKIRALGSWYTKGLDGGSRLRTAINSSESFDVLGGVIEDFFFGRLRETRPGNRSRSYLRHATQRDEQLSLKRPMKSFLGSLIDTPKGFSLTNERTGTVVAWDLATAFDSASRRTGLLRHTSLEEGTALIIAPSNAVHTFFMRFPIDLAFVARDGRIVKAKGSVGPWRLAGALRAFAVIELAAGRLERAGTVRGDRLIVTPTKPGEARSA